VACEFDNEKNEPGSFPTPQISACRYLSSNTVLIEYNSEIIGTEWEIQKSAAGGEFVTIYHGRDAIAGYTDETVAWGLKNEYRIRIAEGDRHSSWSAPVTAGIVIDIEFALTYEVAPSVESKVPVAALVEGIQKLNFVEYRSFPKPLEKRRFDRIIIKHRLGSRSVLDKTGFGQIKKRIAFDDSEYSVVELGSDDDLAESIRLYASIPEVLSVETDTVVRAFDLIPNDEGFSRQWNFTALDMPEAWGISFGDARGNVVVAIVDSGASPNLPDYDASLFVPGWDFVNNDDDPADDNGHGTHVSGTIAEKTDNAIGVSGMAYGVKVMPVKVLDRDGAGKVSDVAEGIKWAVDNGACIINISLGAPSDDSILQSACEYATSRDVLIIAAAGNDGGRVSYPAAYSSVIAVGALTRDGSLAYYSNRGPELDLLAPGGVVYDSDGRLVENGAAGIFQQTIRGYNEITGMTDYSPIICAYAGTSMAAPHVTALAALLKSQVPGRNAVLIRELMITSGQAVEAQVGPGLSSYIAIDPPAALSADMQHATDIFTARLDAENLAYSVNLNISAGPLRIDFATPDFPLRISLVSESGPVFTLDILSSQQDPLEIPVPVTGVYTFSVQLLTS